MFPLMAFVHNSHFVWLDMSHFHQFLKEINAHGELENFRSNLLEAPEIDRISVQPIQYR